MELDLSSAFDTTHFGDVKDIKRTYAKHIKQYRPDTHPIEFAQIREAYERALHRFSATQPTSAPSPDLSVVDAQHTFSSETIEQPVVREPEPEPEPAPPDSIYERLFFVLNDYAETQNEIEGVEVTKQLITHLKDDSLDKNAEFEANILNWLFYSRNILLLPFILLDKYFGWTKKGAYSSRQFSIGEVEWLNALNELATMYDRALQSKDDSLASSKNSLFAFLQIKEQEIKRRKWQRLCEYLQLPDKKAYFKQPSESKFPIYWSDVVAASITSSLLLLLNHRAEIISLFFIGVLSFILILSLRVYVLPLLRIFLKKVNAPSPGKIIAIVLFSALVLNGLLFKDKTPSNVDHLITHAQSLSPTTINLEKTCDGMPSLAPPIYPIESRRLEEEGRVIIKAHVDSKGNTSEVTIEHSSGHERLDSSALDTVKSACMKPATKNDSPVDSWQEIPFEFKLTN